MRCLIFAALCVMPALAWQARTRAIALDDVRLIDGSGRPPVDHVSLLIRDGKIAQIVSAGSSKWPEDVQVMNLAGKTVIPGLINGHGHLGLTRSTSVSPANYTIENIKAQLAQYERYGITTVMSLGMNRDLLYQLRSEQGKGNLDGTSILTADRGIGVPGGVPAVNTAADQIYRPATPEQARKAVQDMASRAANLVKIWVDDNMHKLPAPKPEVYAAAIDEAHRQHLKVAAHVYYLADAKQLLQDKVDILAHSIRDQQIDADALSLLKNGKVFYIPTLQLEESFFVYAGHPIWMDSPFFKDAVSPALGTLLNSFAYAQRVQKDPATETHRKAFRTALLNLKKVHDTGVSIAFGTDSGANPYRIQGWAEHRELELMVEAGLKPLEALHSATAVNAQMLELSEKKGTIALGKQADLVVLDADPETDITNTDKISMVFQNGRRVNP